MTLDSRRIRPGDLFCCLRGEHVDGHDFAARGGRGGCRRPARRPRLDLDARRAPGRRRRTPAGHGPAGGRALGPPLASAMTVVGVTGTNGKTTTTAPAGRDPRRRRLVDRGDRHAHRRAHHARGARAAGPPGRACATRAGGPWRWRCRRTRSPCTGSTARASPSPCSPTSATTTSTSTATMERYFEAKAALVHAGPRRRAAS